MLASRVYGTEHGTGNTNTTRTVTQNPGSGGTSRANTERYYNDSGTGSTAIAASIPNAATVDTNDNGTKSKRVLFREDLNDIYLSIYI